jgi:hypothetical protein
MDDLDKTIAFIMFPCNWGGDWSRCRGFCHLASIDRDKQNVADVMTVVATYTGKTDDFDKRVTQAIFPCNTDGDFHVCDKIHCPTDAIRKHKKQVADVLSAIYGQKILG